MTTRNILSGGDAPEQPHSASVGRGGEGSGVLSDRAVTLVDRVHRAGDPQ